ncbi:hypothetical protein [Sphingomonas lenta]|uniref:Uncharacterized protein n=1 Tax=Sphingomonas lenta TaxID=1141887 RepID=A0A2A2SKB0_9SPHN|nr:hypothetical protein [Sphingomonas lenta]PAX09717.1 hypothetical protein CKY28_03020 [Sphingomonas lenta]
MATSRLRLSSLPTLGGVASGVLVAAAFAFIPAGPLESTVELAGLPAMLPAARPPLGSTARLLLASGGGLFTGATVWAALYLLFGPGGPFAKAGGTDGMPQVRVADAHPDAPPRKPFSAADFEAPPPPVPAPPPVEQPLPRDLDQPLSAFDPAAIPAAPKPPVRPVEPIAPRPARLAPGERIESFEISPRHAEETGAPSIEALLDRLEQGTSRRQDLRRAG